MQEPTPEEKLARPASSALGSFSHSSSTRSSTESADLPAAAGQETEFTQALASPGAIVLMPESVIDRASGVPTSTESGPQRHTDSAAGHVSSSSHAAAESAGVSLPVQLSSSQPADAAQHHSAAHPPSSAPHASAQSNFMASSPGPSRLHSEDQEADFYSAESDSESPASSSEPVTPRGDERAEQASVSDSAMALTEQDEKELRSKIERLHLDKLKPPPLAVLKRKHQYR